MELTYLILRRFAISRRENRFDFRSIRAATRERVSIMRFRRFGRQQPQIREVQEE
jgi:hypothetical protein